MKAKIKISNMGCSACEKIISLLAQDAKGIKLLSISAKAGEAQVEAQDVAALSSFTNLLEKEGYPAKKA